MTLDLVDRNRQRPVHRGTTYPADFIVKRDKGFAGPIRVRMAAMQQRRVQGMRGPVFAVPEGAERILEEQTRGPDLVLGVPMRFGMGFGLKSETFALGPNERICFWGGWGGSLAWIDLDARLTVSYVMNHMESDLLGDLRGGSLVLASYPCLEG